MLAFRPGQFKQRQILKIVKGCFKGDSVVFYAGESVAILAHISVGQWHLGFCILSCSLLMNFSP